MKVFKLLSASFLVFSLVGCTLSSEAVLGSLAMASGVVSSMTESPDYKIYAQRCKEIVESAEKAMAGENQVLTEMAKDTTKNGSVLLYMAMRPKPDVYTRCALAMPKGFLATLAESGNILNFVATIYDVNRNSINARKTLEANKELGLAAMQHQEEMTAMQNALLQQLSRQNIDAFQSGATLRPAAP